MLSENAILWSALSILLMPLLSYVIIFFFGRKLPRQGDWVGVGLLGLTLVQALRIFVTFWRIGDPQFRVEGVVKWIDVGSFQPMRASLWTAPRPSCSW